MDIASSVIQKVTGILLWDDVTSAQVIITVTDKKSVTSSRVTGEQATGTKTTYFIENRCGKAGLAEVARILADLDWQDVATLVFITKNIAEVKSVERDIPPVLQGQGDLYGVDPDYFFSLVPLKNKNHKNIETFIVSLESRAALAGKIKYYIKKIMIVLGCSSALYEQYVYCIFVENSKDDSIKGL